MNKLIVFIISVFYINFAFSQEDIPTAKMYNNKFSIYLTPISIIDPYNPSIRLGIDYPIYKKSYLDFSIQVATPRINEELRDYIIGENGEYKLNQYYGSRILIKYPLKLAKYKNKEFRFNTGLELFYNFSIVDCKNSVFTKDNETSYNYETANYNRNKYGANIFFSTIQRKGIFLIESYWGMGVAAVYYKYYNVSSKSINNYGVYNESIFGIGVRSYAKYAETTFIKPDFILGLKIGYNFINK